MYDAETTQLSQVFELPACNIHERCGICLEYCLAYNITDLRKSNIEVVAVQNG